MNKDSQKLYKKLLLLFLIPHIVGIVSLVMGNVVLFLLSNLSVFLLIFICFKIIDKYNYVIINGKKAVSDETVKNREKKVDKFIKKKNKQQ